MTHPSCSSSAAPARVRRYGLAEARQLAGVFVTDKQISYLRYAVGHEAVHGTFPRLTDFARHFGVPLQTASTGLRGLLKKGLIAKRGPVGWESLTDSGKRVLEAAREAGL
jgi:DNA-binding MarR family transcriptional regulator